MRAAFIVGSLRDGFPANMKNPRDHSGRPFLARWTDSGSCRAFADRRALTNPAARRRADPVSDWQALWSKDGRIRAKHAVDGDREKPGATGKNRGPRGRRS